MKSGDVEEGKDLPTSDINALTDLVKGLQKEIKTLKEKQPNPTAGIAPEDLVRYMAQFSADAGKAKEKDYTHGIQAEDIPEEDFLADMDAVTFCAPFLGYAIADDRRRGHRVLLPYNKQTILFVYQGESRRRTNSKEESLSVFSTYTSQSKKEVKWLREHTFFNTMFYESTAGSKSFDVIKAQKLSRIMTMVSNFELPALIARCKEYGVPISTDKDMMRPMLSMAMAEKELQSEQNVTQRRLMEIEEEKAKLMQKA